MGDNGLSGVTTDWVGNTVWRTYNLAELGCVKLKWGFAMTDSGQEMLMEKLETKFKTMFRGLQASGRLECTTTSQYEGTCYEEKD